MQGASRFFALLRLAHDLVSRSKFVEIKVFLATFVHI